MKRFGVVLSFFVTLIMQAAETGWHTEVSNYAAMSPAELCNAKHRVEIAMDEDLETWLGKKWFRRDASDIGFFCCTVAPAACACCLTVYAQGNCDPSSVSNACTDDCTLNTAGGLLCGLFSSSFFERWYQPDQSKHHAALAQINKALHAKIKQD